MLVGSFFWISLFITLSVAALIIVPWSELRKLLLFSIVSGFLLSVLISYLAVNVFFWWMYSYTGLFSITGIPLFASLTWTPAVIIYSYLLSWPKTRTLFYGYIIGAAAATSGFMQFLDYIGYVQLIRWNYFDIFVMGVILFSMVNFALTHLSLIKRRTFV